MNPSSSRDSHLDPQAHVGSSPSPRPDSVIRDLRHPRQRSLLRGSGKSPASQARPENCDGELGSQPPSGPNLGNLGAAGRVRCSRQASRLSGRGSALRFLGRWGRTTASPGKETWGCISCSTWARLLCGPDLQGCGLAGKMKVDRSQVTLFLPARKSVKHLALSGTSSGSALCKGEPQDPPHAPPPP